jgi:hypothetical protein
LEGSLTVSQFRVVCAFANLEIVRLSRSRKHWELRWGVGAAFVMLLVALPIVVESFSTPRTLNEWNQAFAEFVPIASFVISVFAAVAASVASMERWKRAAGCGMLDLLLTTKTGALGAYTSTLASAWLAVGTALLASTPVNVIAGVFLVKNLDWFVYQTAVIILVAWCTTTLALFSMVAATFEPVLAELASTGVAASSVWFLAVRGWKPVDFATVGAWQVVLVVAAACGCSHLRRKRELPTATDAARGEPVATVRPRPPVGDEPLLWYALHRRQPATPKQTVVIRASWIVGGLAAAGWVVWRPRWGLSGAGDMTAAVYWLILWITMFAASTLEVERRNGVLWHLRMTPTTQLDLVRAKLAAGRHRVAFLLAAALPLDIGVVAISGLNPLFAAALFAGHVSTTVVGYLIGLNCAFRVANPERAASAAACFHMALWGLPLFARLALPTPCVIRTAILAASPPEVCRLLVFVPGNPDLQGMLLAEFSLAWSAAFTAAAWLLLRAAQHPLVFPAEEPGRSVWQES